MLSCGEKLWRKRQCPEQVLLIPANVKTVKRLHPGLWSSPDSNGSATTMNCVTFKQVTQPLCILVLLLNSGATNSTYVTDLWGWKELMNMKVLRSGYIASNIPMGDSSVGFLALLPSCKQGGATLLLQTIFARMFVYKQPWKIEIVSPSGSKSSHAYCPVW